MIVKLLWVTGILSGIAIFFRGSVLLGMYLGILPGVILAVSPTIFIYLATFAVLRVLIPLPAGMGLNLLAGLLTLGIGVAVAIPGALAGRAAFAQAVTGDIVPAQPVPIAGNVRLERLGRANPASGTDKEAPRCDALCAALLDTPGVLSVTLTGRDYADKPIVPVTYRLVPKAQAPDSTLAPVDPVAILQSVPEPVSGPSRDFRASIQKREALQNSIRAHWAMRLATEQSLVMSPVPAADLVITLKELDAVGPHRIAVTEIELRNAGGQVLMRRQHVTAAPTAIPFYLAPEGPMLDQGFGVGRSFLHSGKRHGEIKPVKALFEGTTLARPKLDAASVDNMRERLVAALNGKGPRADLSMVASWLKTLDWQKLAPADVDLLAVLIADPTVDGLDDLYDGYAKYVALGLRHAIAVRLLDPRTVGKLRYRLDDLVRHMPAGTYATLLPEEETLLHNPVLRRDTASLILRLADQGSAAVPRLIDLLETEVHVQPWAKRQSVIKAVCRALSRLGPTAAPALPVVERLFALPGNPISNTWRDAEAWRVAMVRMGKLVDALPFPSNSTPEQVAKDRADIARMAARPIDPDRED